MLSGSRALTLPYDGYQATLCFPGRSMGSRLQATSVNSNKLINKYLSYLQSGKHKKIFGELLHLERMEQDLEDGLFLFSTIPSGYGLGSSGALVAAIFDRYAREPAGEVPGPVKLLTMKRFFGKMEGFFHGSSSGIDPLSIWLGRPILHKARERLSMVEIPCTSQPGQAGFFLVNTHIPRKTQEQVAVFRNKMTDPLFRRRFSTEYIPTNDDCIRACLGADSGLPLHLGCLSHLQLELFREMIPRNFLEVWIEGLESGHYILKLCGAGGGGFLLGYTLDRQEADTQLQKHHVESIPLMG